MKTAIKIYMFPAVIFGMIVSALAFCLFTENILSVSASAPTYESYNSTIASSTMASATLSTSICTGSCQLGSIVVNQVGTDGYVRIWNATSTATSTYATTDTATSSNVTVGMPIARVYGASDAAGTLIYDVVMNKGIVVEVGTGFDGEYTITYKH